MLYMYSANRWESNVTFGVLHMRLMSYIRTYVKQLLLRAAVQPVVYMAYTVDFRSTCLLSRVSHVTFPTVVTVSIVRSSILFVLMNSWYY